ncbi:MAG: hypothetical protein Q9187_001839 [Circinaria calcarea]
MADGSVLTLNDRAVLSKLFDPESAPNAGVLIDPSLPYDPNIQDVNTLACIKREELVVIKSLEQCLRDPSSTWEDKHQRLSHAYDRISVLVDAYPNSASLLNNRAQIFRLQYGDSPLISHKGMTTPGKIQALAGTALKDLNEAIRLLSPPSPQCAISPNQCRVLAQAHTQRAAMYHAVSKKLAHQDQNPESMPAMTASLATIGNWKLQDFEEAASRDFFMGGRYGNEVGKALAVHTNPTAKLCGQIVQEAMRREYMPSTSRLG